MGKKRESLNHHSSLPEGQPPTRAPAKKSATVDVVEEEAKPEETSDSDKDSPLGSESGDKTDRHRKGNDCPYIQVSVSGHKGHHSPELKARTASSTTTATQSTQSTSKQASAVASWPRREPRRRDHLYVSATNIRPKWTGHHPSIRRGQPLHFGRRLECHAQPLTRPSATQKKRTKKTTHSKLAPCVMCLSEIWISHAVIVGFRGIHPKSKKCFMYNARFHLDYSHYSNGALTYRRQPSPSNPLRRSILKKLQLTSPGMLERRLHVGVSLPFQFSNADFAEEDLSLD
ncbi:hypothetical protein PROFUN_16213 [Planoprotostelium fungivorum]|uniref:Uncharacterized protein n=1 Tax=Planoprotostelium fungivorum TaxID=1890364 RepID=A0A2P6MNL3_9EUKA|nr:hypothetical protein PROFUN_16213 [Planoprotostelium fungivorum]